MRAFSCPAALVLLLLIPALFALRAAGVLRRPFFYATLADWGSAVRHKGTSARQAGGVFCNVLFVSSYVCAVIALAAPITQEQQKVYRSISSQVMFVLDTSPSMAAMDMDGVSRLEAAKKAIRELVQKTGGAALALTAVSSEAAVVVPPTTDRETFLRRLDSLAPGYMGSGTALGTALATAACHLSESNAPSKCCVLVTDGENNAGFVSSETAAGLLERKGIALYVLGVGKNGTAPMEYTDPETGKLYRGTFESRFDPSVLQSVAKAGGGKYFDIQNEEELSGVLSEVSRNAVLTQSYYLRTETADKSAVPLAASLVLAVLAWVLKRIVLQETL